MRDSSTVYRDPDADTAKAAFKFDLIRTVNADPKMKPADLALVFAHVEFMSWPDRKAWLSTSRARAMTGLSERQVVNSRKRASERGYLSAVGKKGVTTIFQLNNPRSEDMRAHVEIMTEYFREQQAERQARRRATQKPVYAVCADTQDPMSQSPGECDVYANSAGNSSEYTSDIKALKKGVTFEGSDFGVVASNGVDFANTPYKPPESEQELEEMLSELVSGFSPAVVGYFRKKFVAGQLTPAMVEEQRRVAS